MDFPELVQNLCKRPGMYVNPATLETVMAYVNGFDTARDRGPLAGFREWLIVRNKWGNNLHWSSLVVRLLPDLTEQSRDEGKDDQNRIAAFGMILNEFLTLRAEQGLTAIFHDYRKWLMRQRWYTESLRKKRDK